MAPFHVYVEGPVDRSPDAITRLATAISAKYGLPAPELVTRMGKGRFRVKANIDRATADTYAHALEQVGARVTIEDAQPAAAAAPASPERPATASMPPSNAARQQSSSLPPSTKAKAAPLQSGLSAAFLGEDSITNLGALDGLSLASLDGNDGGTPADAFEPSPQIAPSSAPAKAAAPRAKPTKPAPDVPLDLFAPPSEGAELKVDLADDELEHRARKNQSIPPATVAPPSQALAPPVRRNVPSIQPTTEVVRTTDEIPRARFALGMLLAICLGFVPAHLFASWRESTVFQTIDARVEATQRNADTPEMYGALDSFRETELGRKKTERRNIALIALLVWAAAGAGLGFVWFRKIPWGRQHA